MPYPITGPDIDRVVTKFYARVRVHPVLGPVFNGRIAADAWPAHEDKISRFWRNALLQERNYHGFPMRTHLQTPEIKADMFAHWLSLFDQVLAEELDAEIAERWSAVAHRIGAGMRIGVADRDAPKDAVPKLFQDQRWLIGDLKRACWLYGDRKVAAARAGWFQGASEL